MEAISRFMFAFVVAVGLFSGQSVVALGMVAAPLFSLSVVPWAVRRSLRRSADPVAQDTDSHYVAELDAASSSEPTEDVEFTLSAVAVFASCVALAFLVLGPWLMHVLFGGGHHYARGGLVIVAVGMGVYLSAATLNQAALAQARARQAAIAWICTALAFVAYLAIPWGFDDKVLQVEIGYLGASTLLCTLLYLLYRRPVETPNAA